MHYRRLLVLLSLLIVFCAPASAPAQEKLRLAWAGFSPTNSPIWVMEDRKLLQKQGVSPEIIAINASPSARYERVILLSSCRRGVCESPWHAVGQCQSGYQVRHDGRTRAK